MFGGQPMSPRATHALLLTAAAVWLSALFWNSLGIPFLADDYEFLKVAAEMASPLDAFRGGHTSPKPLHHLIFWWGAHATGPDPAWMRVPGFLAHGLALCFVFRLAKQAGASVGHAAAAAILYAAFATTRSLYWPVAISGFLRVTCALAALSFYVDATRKLSAALLAVSFTLLAMAAHQSGALMPVFFVMWSVLIGSGGLGERALRGVHAALHPVVLTALAIVVAYFFWAARTPDQYRGFRDLGAIAANTLRGLVALAPDSLRMHAVEAARGQAKGVAFALGWATVLCCAAFYGWRLVRGSGIWRFAIVAGACDIALGVVTAGYSQRYAYLAGALLAIALATSATQATNGRHRAGWLAGMVVLFAAWLSETWRITRELRDAGTVLNSILDRAERTSRDLGPDSPLVVVNAPDVWGKEHDLPLLNWGLEPALRMRGIQRPIRQVRTTPARTSTAQSLISAAELEKLRQTSGGEVLVFDQEAKQVVRWLHGTKLAESR